MIIEKSAKTVDLAVEAALRELNVTRDEIEMDILDSGAKGFIGIGARDARVKITVKHDPQRIAKSFIKEMSVAMGLIVEISTKLSEKHLEIVLSGENIGILIGKRGQTLDALQHIVSLAINRGTAPYVNVTMDAENYRQRRREILENLAQSIARKVKQTKRSVTLEPMNTFERRIIHAALQNDKQILTYSEGKDPFRNIVISPKRG